MLELFNFYNDGMGWICRPCEREVKPLTTSSSSLSRMFREGEAESKMPELSTAALAKWMDTTHQTLICPRCGLTEATEKS